MGRMDWSVVRASLPASQTDGNPLFLLSGPPLRNTPDRPCCTKRGSVLALRELRSLLSTSERYHVHREH